MVFMSVDITYFYLDFWDLFSTFLQRAAETFNPTYILLFLHYRETI